MNVDWRNRNRSSDMCGKELNHTPSSAIWGNGNSWMDKVTLTSKYINNSMNQYSSLRVWIIFGTLLSFVLLFDSIILRQTGVVADRIKGEKGFIVNNEGCKMADLDPFDEISKKYITVEKPIKCEFGSKLPLIESNNTSVFINSAAFDQYYGKNDTAKCCWRSLERTDHDDNKIKFDTTCHDFTNSAKVTAEFVKVECTKDKKQIYRDYHFFVPEKERIKNIEKSEADKAKNQKTESKHRKLSLLMVGLDGVARMQVHRQMPKMKSILEKLGGVEMKGYNKVAENTYPNLVPMLSGLSEKEIENCRNAPNRKYDNCPFLWKNFSTSGYRTVLAEDACFMATFNYLQPGFHDPPTDYYWRGYCTAAENDIGNTFYSHICLGSRLTYQNLLNYTRKIAREFSKKPYFAFFWQSSFTHDHWNYAQLCDETYAEAFDSFHQNGWLENTALIALSDHGARLDQFLNTYPGKVEASLPFMYIVMPKWWKEQYPTAWKNLQKNGERLMTPFDLHTSILDLLDPQSITDESIIKRTKALAETEKGKIPRAISLFLPHPDYRTCDMASILPIYCMCHKNKTISINDGAIKKASHYLVEQLNKILQNDPQGGKLELDSIWAAQSWNQGGTEHGPYPWSDFELIIKTKPDNTVFEALIRSTTKGNHTLLSSIHRWDISKQEIHLP